MLAAGRIAPRSARTSQYLDHPLGLRAEHVQRVRAGQRRITGALQGQHADLRPVAMGHDQVLGTGQRRERRHGLLDVVLLDVFVGFLTPFQQRALPPGAVTILMTAGRAWRS